MLRTLFLIAVICLVHCPTIDAKELTQADGAVIIKNSTDSVTAQSEHFILLSDIPVDGVALLTDLEHFRQAVIADLDLQVPETSTHLRLNIIDNASVFDAITPGGITAGVYLNASIVQDIVIGYSSEPGHILSRELSFDWLKLVFRHEVVHHIMDAYYPRKLPIWLHEGLAEYYSTYSVDETGTTLFGSPLAGQQPLTKDQAWLPLKPVIESLATYPNFRTLSSQPSYKSQKNYYSLSLALANFFMKQPGRLDSVYEFIDGWENSKDSEESFLRVYGLTYAGLKTSIEESLTDQSATVLSEYSIEDLERAFAIAMENRLNNVQNIEGPNRHAPSSEFVDNPVIMMSQSGLTPKRSDLPPLSLPVQIESMDMATIQNNHLRLLLTYGRTSEWTQSKVEKSLAAMDSETFPEPTILAKAIRYSRIKDWDASDEQLNKILDVNPDNALASKLKVRVAYGRLSENQKNPALWSIATMAANLALAQSPNDAELHLYRVAVSLPNKKRVMSPKTLASIDWLRQERTHLKHPRISQMIIPALLFENQLDHADVILSNAYRWVTHETDIGLINSQKDRLEERRALLAP